MESLCEVVSGWSLFLQIDPPEVRKEATMFVSCVGQIAWPWLDALAGCYYSYSIKSVVLVRATDAIIQAFCAVGEIG